MRRLLVPLALALALAGCGSESAERTTVVTRNAGPGVTDLTNVLELRSAFNEDRGSARLLLILSPT